MTTITLDVLDAVELAETLEYLLERICYLTTTIENPLCCGFLKSRTVDHRNPAVG